MDVVSNRNYFSLLPPEITSSILDKDLNARLICRLWNRLILNSGFASVNLNGSWRGVSKKQHHEKIALIHATLKEIEKTPNKKITILFLYKNPSCPKTIRLYLKQTILSLRGTFFLAHKNKEPIKAIVFNENPEKFPRIMVANKLKIQIQHNNVFRENELVVFIGKGDLVEHQSLWYGLVRKFEKTIERTKYTTSIFGQNYLVEKKVKEIKYTVLVFKQDYTSEKNFNPSVLGKIPDTPENRKKIQKKILIS